MVVVWSHGRKQDNGSFEMRINSTFVSVGRGCVGAAGWGFRLGRWRRAARTMAAVLVVCAGASRAVAQPRIDPNDPVAVEAMNARMEEAFEDSPFSVDPAGMTSGEGMFGAIFGPSVTKADFKGFLKILKFDKEQTEAASLIYKQRLENYEVKGKPMQEMISELMRKVGESIGRGGDGNEQPENMEQLTKAAEEIMAERATMNKGVMEDLQAMLTPEQTELWPKVEMAERRNRLMRFQPMLMAPGAQVDVRTVLDVMLSKPGAAKPEQSVQDRIDATLATHERMIDEQARLAIPLDDVFRNSGMKAKPESDDMERMMKMMGEGGVIAERVRVANERAAKEITTALGEPAGGTFMDAYNAAAFPNIYKKTHGETLLDSALTFADLSEEQRGKLVTMREQHVAKLKDLRPKAVEQALAMSRMQAAMMSAKDDEARAKAMEKMGDFASMTARNDMRSADKEVVKQVRALMTDEQREKLPKRPRTAMPFTIQAPEAGGGEK